MQLHCRLWLITVRRCGAASAKGQAQRVRLEETSRHTDVLNASSTRGETGERLGAPVFIGAGHMGTLCLARMKTPHPQKASRY